MTTISDDKTYIWLLCSSLVSTAAAFYFLRQFLVINSGSWMAPMFIPIYFFVLVIFAINTSLSFISYKKDRFLSLAFCFLVISIDLLLLVALILNIKNPNG
ncbi:MAG: hypothetical protein WCP91_02405 [Candidatus Berkelbacteria bacterium]